MLISLNLSDLIQEQLSNEKNIIYFFYFNFFFFLKTNQVYANNNTAFIDLDIVLKKTIIGKLLLNDLEVINNKNIEELKNKEKELKNDEKEIKKKTKCNFERTI